MVTDAILELSCSKEAFTMAFTANFIYSRFKANLFLFAVVPTRSLSTSVG